MAQPTTGAAATNCPFCNIARAFPSSRTHPVPNNPDPAATSPATHIVLSTPTVMAFLDIMPLAEGHLLVVARNHKEKLSDLNTAESAAIGAWLPVLSRAVARAVGGVWDWNVVQNNGARAAQVVPHVHFHIIPRPAENSELKSKSWTMFGKGQREDLDDEQAVVIARSIRQEVEKELLAVKEEEGEGGIRLLEKL